MAETQTTGLQKGVVDRESDEAKDRCLYGQTKGVDLAGRSVDGIASTINLDRDGEMILPSAFSNAAQFLDTNAPFLATHIHRTFEASPSQIGWVMDLKVSKTDVRARFRFAKTGKAEEWWTLASDPDGKGIAFSIGLIPKRWVIGSVTDLVAEFPEIAGPLKRAGLKGEDHLRVYTEIELLEISAVPVPANREALQILEAKLYGGDAYDATGSELRLALIEVIREAASAAVAELRPQTLEGEVLTQDGPTIGELVKKIEQLQRSLVERIDEVIALLPDSVHDAAPPAAPPADDARGPAAAGVGSDGAVALRAAAKALHDQLTGSAT